MNLYLDIDGVLLGKEDPRSPDIHLAHHAEEFLAFALAHFDCFWLTTHCQGRSETVLQYLTPYGSADFMALAEKVMPTRFRVMKTEALTGDFLWLDDAPMQCELDWLSARSWLDRWIRVDTRKRPEDLVEIKQELERRWKAEWKKQEMTFRRKCGQESE